MNRVLDTRVVLALALTGLPAAAVADGIIVDRVYDPYVHPLETELEWRSILQSDDNTNDLSKHLLGFGRTLSERWAAELYVIGTQEGDSSVDINAYELEFKWQLTEQGEYAFDWGALFELERESDEGIWEAAAALLSARDFGRFTAVANLALVYEWGSGIDNEFETRFHLQTRYRYREAFEPAMELHVGQDTSVLGPAITGLYRLSPGKKLRWDAGIFFPLSERSPDQVVKLNVEFEF
jgi:hypothetical protein